MCKILKYSIDRKDSETTFSLVYETATFLPTELEVLTACYGLLTNKNNTMNLPMTWTLLMKWEIWLKYGWQYTNKRCSTTSTKMYVSGLKNVLRKIFPNKNDVNAGKFTTKWEWPYLIYSISERGKYKLATLDRNSVPRSWNAIHLKAHHL